MSKLSSFEGQEQALALSPELSSKTDAELFERRQSENEYKVLRVSVKNDSKRIVMDSGRGESTIYLHRYALVGPGDILHLREGLQRRIWISNAESKDLINVYPTYEQNSVIEFAGDEIPLRVIEPSCCSEHVDHAELEGFHYRGLNFNAPGVAKKKSSGGRKVVLLAQLKIGNQWVSVGYVELQMPLLMAKPRHLAFDRAFSHPSGVSWEAWRRGGQEHVNRIVRIARTVVHPEYRGGQLSTKLVEAAKDFARSRWHIGGKRPLFLEISAEMLRYIDFVSRCGFHYLGETEGNRERIAKDLKSIHRGAKGDSGIMSAQRKYYTAFENYRSLTGESFESLQARIAELLTLPDPFAAMSKEEWAALRPVIRSPIPYYIVGLDPVSDAYVKDAAVTLAKRKTIVKRARVKKIEIDSVEIWSNYDVPHDSYNKFVMSSFGISTQKLSQKLIGSVSFTAHAGTVSFIAGSSGCGKSLLLNRLDPRAVSETLNYLGKISPATYKVGWLKPFPANASLFGYLAQQHGAERAFEALSKVGLSEALLFLKPFEMLSRGQRYRAMLADLILGDDDVWLIDEFCSDLDPLSSRIVAERLHSVVRKEERIAFVAAANHGHFIRALRPSRVIVLRTGRDSIVCGGKDYIDGIFQ
ncbi:GNAT family N-acetyltransferase [Pseudomonas sp. NBRC 111130]|uniref:GNAT family N-acetyltransferase n=1 Tax=Pseudomonas sp. NBRC 111130 TaxID=1661045 RepID=UPI000AA19474|nr:GNAT family N-acetyltransferase [Pseudomonas sp. NBRC 111130]